MTDQKNSRLIGVTLGFLLLTLFAALLDTPRASAQATTPQELCAEGKRRSEVNAPEQALPLLREALRPENRVTLSLDAVVDCSSALGLLLMRSGDAGAALDAFSTMLRAAEASGNPAYLAWAQISVGHAQFLQRRLPDAATAFTSALDDARRIENKAARQQYTLMALQGLEMTYWNQGRFEERVTILREIIALAEAADQRDYLVPGLVALSQTYSALSRFTEGIEVGTRALAHSRETGDRFSEAAMLTSLGVQNASLGRSPEAIRFFEEARSIYRATDESLGRLGEIEAINAIALELSQQGRYGQAFATAQEALQIAETVDPELVYANFFIASKARVLTTLSIVRRYQGNLGAARAYVDEALTLARQLGSLDLLPTLLNNRGDLLLQEAAASLSEASAQQLQAAALADFREVLRLTNAPVPQLTALNNIGVLLSTQGQLAEARVNFTAALQLSREHALPADEAFALFNLGTLAYAQERYAEATDLCRQAQQLARATGGAETEAEAWTCIARALDFQNQPQAALESYEQALAVIGGLRARAGSEQARAGFFERHAVVYGFAANLYLRLGDPTAAFEAIERGRARAFLDSLVTGEVTFADATLNADAEHLRETDAALEAARRELALLRQTTPTSPTLITGLETRITEAEQEYQAAREAIVGRDDQAAALAPDGAVRSLAEIQQSLPADTSLLTYYVGNDSTLVFVVTREDIQAEALPQGREQLIPRVRSLHSFDKDQTGTIEDLASLYADLVTPVREQLKTTRLLIVPHGILHYLPFAALTPDGRRFFGDDYRLSVLPAAALLPSIQRPVTTPTAAPRALILANANLGGERPVKGVEQAAMVIAERLGAEPLLGSQATSVAIVQPGRR